MTGVRRLWMIAVLFSIAALVACSSSPNPNLYTIAPVQGAIHPSGPKVVVLRQIGLARYLERSQIVRSSADYELKVQSNDWWGEPLGAMIARVLRQDLTQRLPGTQVFNDAGAISPDANWQVEVNLLQMDLNQAGVLVLRAQIAVSAKEGEPKTESERFELPVAGPSVAAQVAASSQALGKLSDAIAALVVAAQTEAHPAAASPARRGHPAPPQRRRVARSARTGFVPVRGRAAPPAAADQRGRTREADPMQTSDVIETFSLGDWAGPFDAADRARAVASLEAGKVLYFPRLAFAIEANEQDFLQQEAGSAARKNISLDPATGRVHGTSVQGDDLADLAAMMDRYGRQADALVRGLMPQYAPSLERARTSFRPAEIAGRQYTPRHDDRLMHVDAFPTRPLAGKRILRVFANVAPDGTARRWRVGEPFADFARAFLPRVRSPLPGQAQVLAALRLTKGTRSAYDHIMLMLHDVGKLDAGYQQTSPQADVAFPPGTVWMCYTDCVLHAAMSGRCALEQTFHLPIAAMAEPERSPLRVLERIAGRALV